MVSKALVAMVRMKGRSPTVDGGGGEMGEGDTAEDPQGRERSKSIRVHQNNFNS